MGVSRRQKAKRIQPTGDTRPRTEADVLALVRNSLLWGCSKCDRTFPFPLKATEPERIGSLMVCPDCERVP
jgi:hypothetical protein